MIEHHDKRSLAGEGSGIFQQANPDGNYSAGENSDEDIIVHTVFYIDVYKMENYHHYQHGIRYPVDVIPRV